MKQRVCIICRRVFRSVRPRKTCLRPVCAKALALQKARERTAKKHAAELADDRRRLKALDAKVDAYFERTKDEVAEFVRLSLMVHM